MDEWVMMKRMNVIVNAKKGGKNRARGSKE